MLGKISLKNSKKFKIIIIGFISLSIMNCGLLEPETEDNSVTKSVPAIEINKIITEGKTITVNVSYGVSYTGWYYLKTKSEKMNDVYTAKVFAKHDTGIGCTIPIYFEHEHVISFDTKGEKYLKFWQNDSTYLDTTLIL